MLQSCMTELITTQLYYNIKQGAYHSKNVQEVFSSIVHSQCICGYSINYFLCAYCACVYHARVLHAI